MLAFVLAAALAQAPVTLPSLAELQRQIGQADAELFSLLFERPCDPPAFRALLAPDMEFYHDKAGFNARNADQFMKLYGENCGGRADPTNWRSRRVLVTASSRVDPVPGWGAIHSGEHLFYERHGIAGTEQLAGRARFANLWVLGADGKWRLSRVFSYAHEAASESPPPPAAQPNK